MNYYERYVGDFQRDTGHLSCTEIGAYDRLLDHYYATEAPLPEELGALYRICRAMDKVEQSAVRAVAEQFFPMAADGMRHNTRADREILKAQNRIGSARENGKKGGRPPKRKPEHNPNETGQKPNGFQSANPSETHAGVHHAPCTSKTQQQEAASVDQPMSAPQADAAASPPSDPIHARAIELTVLMRKRGAAMQASDPRVRAWAESGITDAQALTALETAQQRRADQANPQPINAGYLDAILKDIVAGTGQQPRRRNIHDERAATIAGLTGRAGDTADAEGGQVIDGSSTVVG